MSNPPAFDSGQSENGKKIQFSFCKMRRNEYWVISKISAKSFYLNVEEKSAVPGRQNTNAK